MCSPDRKLKKDFEKYVDLDKIDWDKSSEEGREAREVEYVIVAVSDEDLERQAFLIGEVGAKASHSSGMVLGLHGSIITVVWGAWPTDEPAPDRPAQFVESLRELGSEVRAVAGRATGLVGNIGWREHWSYTALIPGYTRAVGTLLALKGGEVGSASGSA